MGLLLQTPAPPYLPFTLILAPLVLIDASLASLLFAPLSAVDSCSCGQALFTGRPLLLCSPDSPKGVSRLKEAVDCPEAYARRGALLVLSCFNAEVAEDVGSEAVLRNFLDGKADSCEPEEVDGSGLVLV